MALNGPYCADVPLSNYSLTFYKCLLFVFNANLCLNHTICYFVIRNITPVLYMQTITI